MRFSMASGIAGILRRASESTFVSIRMPCAFISSIIGMSSFLHGVGENTSLGVTILLSLWQRVLRTLRRRSAAGSSRASLSRSVREIGTKQPSITFASSRRSCGMDVVRHIRFVGHINHRHRTSRCPKAATAPRTQRAEAQLIEEREDARAAPSSIRSLSGILNATGASVRMVASIFEERVSP